MVDQVRGPLRYSPSCCSWTDYLYSHLFHLHYSNINNGPLRVLPSTHCLGVLSDHAITALTHTISPFECHAQRGEVLSMSPLLIHSSSKAASADPRRVLQISYASTF